MITQSRFIRTWFIALSTAMFGSLCATTLQGQSLSDYLRRYEIVLGGIYSQSDLYDIYNGERVSTQRLHTVVPGANVGIGLHVPLVELNDRMSIGINPDVEMFIGAAPYDPAFPEDITHLDQSTGAFRLAVPIFATLKYGTDATIVPETDMGFGVGLGIRPVINLGAAYSYATPVAMGEVSFLLADMLVKLRATAPLTAGSPADAVDIRTYEFSILFLPGE